MPKHRKYQTASIYIQFWCNIFCIYRIERNPNIRYLQNIWKPLFLTQKQGLWIFHIFSRNSDHSIMTQYSVCTEFLQNFPQSKFFENTKVGIFRLSQGLSPCSPAPSKNPCLEDWSPTGVPTERWCQGFRQLSSLQSKKGWETLPRSVSYLRSDRPRSLSLPDNGNQWSLYVFPPTLAKLKKIKNFSDFWGFCLFVLFCRRTF